MTPTQDDVERRRGVTDALLKLQHEYRAGFPARMLELRSHIRLIPAQSALGNIAQLAHGLAGSGATFGYPQVTRIAQEIERLCGDAQAGHGPSDGMLIARLNDAATRLQWAFDAGPSPVPGLPASSPSSHHRGLPQLLLVIDDDPLVRHDLSTQLQCYNYRVVELIDPAEIADTVKKHGYPIAIVLDLGFPGDALGGARAVPTIQKICPTVPIVVLSGRSDFEARLHAARAGCSGYQVKPVNINSLVDQIKLLTNNETAPPYRVMIIDDDRGAAVYYQALLKEAGMVAQIVIDALTVQQTIEEFGPELLLLDLYMPDWSGLEIAAAIRHHADYVSLPIVFLSSETLRSSQLEALRIGADDFLTKPITPDRLVDAISTRAQRYRDLRRLMTIDTVTGTLNHGAIIRHIEAEIARSMRTGAPFCVAMIDVDHFKQVNDTYGHRNGDLVLRALCNLLRQRLRSSDTIGRYGGEEFLVLLPDTILEYGVRTMEWLRDAFATIEHRDGNTAFPVTFSCGVAAFPEFQSTNQLLEAADRQMYRAKEHGRNRVFPLLPTDPS